MNDILNIFSNRELSVLLWLSIFTIYAIKNEQFRKSLINVIKIATKKSFLFIYVLLAIYLTPIVIYLIRLESWSTKDFIIWLFAIAFVLMVNISNARDQSTRYFTKIIINGIKLTILVEFVINFYSFGFITELIFFPILVLIIAVNAFSETDKKYDIVSNVLQNILAIIGLMLVSYTLYRTVINLDGLFNYTTIKAFLFPIILTTYYIPFLYSLTIHSIYQIIFIRFNILIKKKDENKFAKRTIIKVAKVNINKLNNINKKFNLIAYENSSNRVEYVKEISNH